MVCLDLNFIPPEEHEGPEEQEEEINKASFDSWDLYRNCVGFESYRKISYTHV
jgi:hypothetical protein